MNRINVNDLPNYLNQEIESYFLVTEKELRQGAKDYFLRLKLADKTGSAVANIWRNASQKSEMFNKGDVIRIKGMVIKYNKNIQISVSNIFNMESREYDLVDLIPSTNKDVNKLADNLYSLIDSIKDEHLNKLLNNIFQNKQFFTLFLKAPAAKSWHHNYAGGLIEHSISVARICDFASNLYGLDRDLLITGAILHDIGKVYEYNSNLSIDFSTEGRLLGHFVIGDRLITEHAAKIDLFPKETLMKLRHMVLAHHGEIEKGTVRVPQTLEAMVLHLADNMDAQTIGIQQVINNSNGNNEWSEFDKLNQKFYYKG
ncbi:MAG: 3'-5' exonuclease [Candidatus Cloacimonetes bacterium 4572_65]|nr:MAG: 3'-5' exonuclease [Candidatus Cloacimonetes bacterium 4572_65]